MDENTRYMTTREVAAYVGLSPRTLESYRSRGGGPPYYDLGGVVRYLLSEVADWVSVRRRHSTSDDGLRIPVSKDGDEENDGEDEDGGADGPRRVR
ncbi:MAG: helix-turn-helix domain-containing protein [Rhodospirillaceae bacterium]|nr:helix-turn-helix domain-containing protein [Rhodospirillaceae bacterium]